MKVYTAIYGGSDSLKPLPEGVTGVVFTDDHYLIDDSTLKSWELRVEPLTHLGGPRTRAKFWKVRPDLANLGSHTTLWIDGSMALQPGGLELLESALEDNEAVFFRHHDRDCVFEEVDASFGGRPLAYAGQPLNSQVEHYRQLGLLPHAGLFASGCMIRQDTPAVRAMNRCWWDEICRWSLQDQLSLTVAVQSVQELRWTHFPWLMTEQTAFQLLNHTKENGDNEN